MTKQKKKHIILRIVLLVLAGIVLLSALAVGESFLPKDGGNAYSCLLTKTEKSCLASIERIDDNGYLYYAEYDGDYSSFSNLFAKVLNIATEPGCTVFSAYNENGDFLTNRNYDCNFQTDDGSVRACNLVLHTKGEGKYESLAIADVALLSFIGMDITNGTLDDGKSNLTLLSWLPYLCVDGMNEKGLTVSILCVDVTEEEKPINITGKEGESGVATVLLRELLDHSATVEEAIAYCENYNFKNMVGECHHFYVSDATGKSVIIEWRYNTFTTLEIDIATNFYLTYTDAKDCYYGEDLKEAFLLPNDIAIANYSFGYGHGYARFITVAQALYPYKTNGEGYATLSEAQMLETLKSTWQTNNGKTYGGHNASNTIYGAQYNSTNLSLSVTSYFSPEKTYSFQITTP